MKRLLIVGALAVAAGQAFAADLPQPMPPPQAPAMYVPAVVPVYNWAGIYYGVNGGYGFGNSKWTDPANTSLIGTTGTFSTTGFVVGPTLGVNFQTNAFVFGIEGDFDGAWLKGDVTSLFCNALGPGTAQCETKDTWLATLRGRVGYAVDRVLFYGTAGGALGGLRTGLAGFNEQKTTKAGWTAGAGIEAAFTDNVTARIEYLYVGLANTTCNTGTACGFDAGVPANQTITFNTSLIRVGVDYKFR